MKETRCYAVLVCLVAGLLLLMLACAPRATPAPPPQATPSPQAVSEWDRVVAAARKEGTVTIYGGLGSDVQTAIQEGFMKATGIRVEALAGEGPELEEKIRMEHQIGVVIADFLISAITTPIGVKGAGFIRPVNVALPEAENKGVWKMHPYDLDTQKGVVVLWMDAQPDILTNTNMVKEGEVTSWYDLLDPRWKGKMNMKDPRFKGAALGFPAMKVLGEDFWRRMAKQDIWLEDKSGRQVDAVVLGEKAIGIGASTSRTITAIGAGAPVKFLHMKEGSHIVLKGAGLITESPHPNAALVLLNWLMSREGQIAVGRATGQDTLRKDIDAAWVTVEAFKPGAAKAIWPDYLYRGDVEKNDLEAKEFFIRIFGARGKGR